MEHANQEIYRVRLRLIDLIKSFFLEKPDAELLSRWRGTFSALSKEQISPLLDNSVRNLSRQLGEKSLEDIQDEYYALFVDPFGEDAINLIASQHFDGRNYGETLILIRDIFKQAGIAKNKTVADPEDSLPVLFDLLGTLVEMEKDGEDTSESQDELTQTFLAPFLSKLKPVFY
ncbi:MAG: molecular chaperone TorD family protein [Desulfofustis sp.]